MDERSRLADVEAVPTDSTLLVTLEVVETGGEAEQVGGNLAGADGDELEVILTRLGDDTVVAFRNYCQHWTDVRFDRGSGAAIRNGQLVCQKHGATFDRDSGYCDFGPCEGATLETVDITVDADGVYLTDDDYTFLQRGGIERDVDDLSSGGRIGFDGV